MQPAGLGCADGGNIAPVHGLRAGFKAVDVLLVGAVDDCQGKIVAGLEDDVGARLDVGDEAAAGRGPARDRQGGFRDAVSAHGNRFYGADLLREGQLEAQDAALAEGPAVGGCPVMGERNFFLELHSLELRPVLQVRDVVVAGLCLLGRGVPCLAIDNIGPCACGPVAVERCRTAVYGFDGEGLAAHLEGVAVLPGTGDSAVSVSGKRHAGLHTFYSGERDFKVRGLLFGLLLRLGGTCGHEQRSNGYITVFHCLAHLLR